MAESPGYAAEQAAEQDQSGGGFRGWFVAHERTVLIVGLLGIGVTIFLFWKGHGSNNASSNSVPGSGGIPTTTVTDSSTTQALNNLTQAISNLLGQLGTKGGGNGNNTGGTGIGSTSLGPPGPPTPKPGGTPSFATFLSSLGIASAFYSLPGNVQSQGQAVYTNQGPDAFVNWLRLLQQQMGSTGGGGGPSPIPGPPPAIAGATPALVAPTLPTTQQVHYPLGALGPRPILPAPRR